MQHGDRRRTPGARGSDGGWARTVLDWASSALWPVPALLTATAVAAGVVLPRIERSTGLGDGTEAGTLLDTFGGGPDAARTICSVIAGSLITVTSLTFSLTVVSLQLFSSQFSPRLLRSFAADRTVQVTLGVLLATFAYSLAVLRTIRSEEENGQFVPRLSVTVALLLALASVAVLVVFLAHIVRQLRVETVMQSVADDARATIDRMLPTAAEAAPAPALPVPVPAGAVPLEARRTGFLLRADRGELLDAATGPADAVVLLHATPGDWLVAGTPMATAWPLDLGGTVDAEELAAAVDKALSIGAERTGVADIGIGMRQLVDIAAKALSPGINDPVTAVHALGHLSALLCELAGRDLAPHTACDADGRVRAVVPQRQFPELLDLIVGEVRRYGSSEPAVLSRLLVLLREVGWRARTDEQADAVRHQVRLVLAAAERDVAEPADRGGLGRLGGQVEAALHRRWSPPGARTAEETVTVRRSGGRPPP